MTANDYTPTTALTDYYVDRSTNRPARHWATEKLVHDMGASGLLNFFEGPGPNPMALSGASTLKFWLDTDAGVTATPGTLKRYVSGDATNENNWSAVNISAYFNHLGGAAITDAAATLLATLMPANILAYGAEGDGVTNDTAALAAALVASPIVYFPAGRTYLISAAAYTSSMTFIGEDVDTTIIKWANATGSDSLFDVNAASALNINWSNITIDCNRQAHTDTSLYFAALDVAAVDGCRIRLERCRFINGRINDIRVQGPTTSGEMAFFDMRDCEFEDGLVGTATRSAACVQLQDNVDAELIGNRASLPTLPASYGRAGFLVQRASGSPVTSAGRLVAAGNRFKNIGRGTADTLGCIDVYNGANVISITGNTCDGVPGRGINVKGDQSSITITGNVIRNTTGTACTAIAMFQDLFDSDVDRDLVISGNVITDSESDGIFFDGNGTGQFTNALISNNVISGVDNRGVYVRYCTSVSVKGNEIDGAVTGITVSDVSALAIVSGNKIENVTTTHAINVAEIVANAMASARIVIAGNVIRASASRGVSISSDVGGYDIVDNVIDGATTAIVTAGSVEFSRIERNTAINITTALSRSGTDAALSVRGNAFETVIAFATRELTIASGVVTVFAEYHYVDTEADAASDDLDTINGGFDGQVVTLFAANNSRDVVVKDGTGNLRTNGDFTMNNVQDSITLMKRGTEWVELARSDNAA